MKNFYFFILALTSFFGNAQLTIVKDVAASNLAPVNNNNHFWRSNEWNGKRYYAVSALSSFSLAETDGTAAGTKIVKTLNFTGIVSASLEKIIPAKDFFYMQVNVLNSTSPYIQHNELWKSDGTAAGTVLVKRFDDRSMFAAPIEISSNPYFYENKSLSGNEMYFLGYDTVHGYEMWKTDGTNTGTYMVVDQYTGTIANVIASSSYTRLGDKVYFISSSKLWSTDGTEAGTAVVDVPNIFPVGSTPMTVYKGKLYFMAYDEQNGVELWVSDGTASGTHMFKNCSPNSNNLYSHASFNLRTNGKYLVFSTLNGTSTTLHTLFKTDGTVEGTHQISPVDALAGGTDTSYTNFDMDDHIFYAYNSTSKTIFKYDFDNNEHSIISHPNIAYNFKNLGKTAWYSSGTFYQGGGNDFNEPYRTDGVQAEKAFDLNTFVLGTNNSGSYPYGLFTRNNDLFFFANTATGIKLYKFHPDFTFNKSASSKWSKPENWNTGLIPFLSDDALIPPNISTIDVDANAFAKNLDISSPLNLSSGSLNVSGNLNLGAKITLNNNNLNLKGGNSLITNGTSTNYVVTIGTGTVNVENLNAERGIVNLPIGTATNYNPVSIANTGTSDTFSARVSEGIANTTNGAVNATWEISEATAGGSNVSLTLGWNTSQQNAAFNSASAKVGHYLNGNWTEENSGAVSNNSITATGISSFSPFAVMNFGALAATDFSKSKVSVYPNPFNENLNISTENGGVVNFYDLSGKLVSTSVLMKGTNSLNKSSLAKGAYIYQIKNTNGKIISSGKVIKN